MMHARNSLVCTAIESDAINIHPPRYIYPFVIFEPYTIPSKRAELCPSAEILLKSFGTLLKLRREVHLRVQASIGLSKSYIAQLF